MLLLTLGIIIGLLIAVIIVATSVYLQSRGKEPLNVFTQSLEAKLKPQGSIIKPKSDMVKLFERNQSEGKDTYLSDL